MVQNLNIIVSTTATESPWRNRLNEQDNGILREIVKKAIEDTNCCFEVTLARTISTKNTLPEVHDYSPNQLAFDRNPNFPSLVTDKLSALEGVSTSEVVEDNLNAMHVYRK